MAVIEGRTNFVTTTKIKVNYQVQAMDHELTDHVTNINVNYQVQAMDHELTDHVTNINVYVLEKSEAE